jgi:hypothetical protein
MARQKLDSEIGTQVTEVSLIDTEATFFSAIDRESPMVSELATVLKLESRVHPLDD